ncbi:hypothetical protein PQO03_07700 [Lentisphaera profundi]|uniref:Uncharacterized protein n=1 Tax=Lentisphaera profundi TaxID=1658616 RepID=A0ABY7VQW4_9BACT|nr:hypothetical protein [Lentisphaera profundi]WDE95603.1 hypothetical protein PQO03_07700 [Lentisphaera profundi]
MRNKSLLLLISLFFVLLSCDKTKAPVQKLKAGDLEVQWQPNAAQITSTDLLEYNFTAIHPLATQIELQILENDDFELFDQSELIMAPASPSTLRTQFTMLFEPPAPGQYSSPKISIILKADGAILSQVKSSESKIVIASINAPEDFVADHQGSLKQRPPLYILLILIVLLLPFLPRKKKTIATIKLKISAKDIEACEESFAGFEELLQKTMMYNFLIHKDDLATMLSSLASDNPSQMKLKNFIDSYLSRRFSPETVIPGQLIAEFKKVFEEISS